MINVKKFVKNAIIEDNGRGDLFFDIAPKGRFSAKVIAKDDGILAGVVYAKALSKTEKFDCKFLIKDGEEVRKGDIIAVLEGKASILLSSERTFLNLLQQKKLTSLKRMKTKKQNPKKKFRPIQKKN